ASLVDVSLTVPCSTLTIFITALGTAAPLESVTRPEMDARFSCACNNEAAARVAKRTARRAKDIERILSAGSFSPGVNRLVYYSRGIQYALDDDFPFSRTYYTRAGD